jgi:hypothetical protein
VQEAIEDGLYTHGRIESRARFARLAEGKRSKEAGQVFPPPRVSPFGEIPASLTEGGQPVVCWPGYETPVGEKKFHVKAKK